jgi:hypothetical protein
MIRLQKLIVLTTMALAVNLLVTPCLQAQNATAPATETVQNVGSTHWRIGSRTASNGIYIQAPANLTPSGVEWTKLPATGVFSRFSAQNDSLRVELVRGSGRNYEAIRDAAFEHIGGQANAAKNIKVATYDGVRLDKDGKVAFAIKYGTDVWAIVILPQKAADAAVKVKDSADTIWFERREAPQWKDRMIGSTSFQADLPFELTPRPTKLADTVAMEARWRNFWVDATEYRSGKVDLDGTIKIQIEDIKKQPGAKNVRVKQIPRSYSWAFVEGSERGQFLQIDYDEGETKRRIYKVFSFAGTRVVSFQITLNATDSTHLLNAHRILSTARIGWTDSNQFSPRRLEKDKVEFDSDTPFKLITTDGGNIYQGNDPLALACVIETPKAQIPTDVNMKADANSMIEMTIKNVLRGAGGQLTNSRIETLSGGIFPSRRVVFEGKMGKQYVNGDAVMISTSNKVYFPFRITDTTSSDWARRWVTTFKAELTPSANWTKKTIGGVENYAPKDSTISADGTELTGEADSVKLKIKAVRQKYVDAPNFNPAPNETSPVTDSEIQNALGRVPSEMAWDLEKRASAAGVKNARGVSAQPVSTGNLFGVAGWYPYINGKFTCLDIYLFHDGETLWSCELSWNHNDIKSAQTRDAVLASIKGN